MCVHNETLITKTLNDRAGLVEQLGPGSWEFSLSNGVDLRVAAHLDKEWLLMGARCPGGLRHRSAQTVWHLLHANSRLAGAVKFAVPPGDRGEHELFARAELPIDDATNLSGRIGAACAGFKAAAAAHTSLLSARGLLTTGPEPGAMAHGRAEGIERIVEAQSGGDGGHAAEGPQESSVSSFLSRLCSDAGWEFTERSGGALVIGLDVPAGFHQATLQGSASGAVVLAAELHSVHPTPSPCQYALGVLLLRANGALRMARAAVGRSDAPAAARFEVVFGDPPCSRELAHGLSALSIACRLYAEEARLLQQDERIAQEYLRRWG
jgi:hypothetical protein